MSQLLCLIVDDEPIAREIIKSYCSYLPSLQVVSAVGNAIEAKQILQTHKVDIVFLDINMPVLDGIAFMKTLKLPPQVIFTTAYKEYAVDAFDLAACDYLLKPFSLERFIIAVDKAIEKISHDNIPLHSQSSFSDSEKPSTYLFIKFEGKIFKVQFDDLLYAEAQGNYTKLVTSQHTLLPNMTFTNLDELLPSSMFIRVHRSFIINQAKITHIEGNRVFVQGFEIPIGNSYRDDFLRHLGF